MAKRRDEDESKRKKKPAESDRHELEDSGFVEPDAAAEMLDVAVKKTPSWMLSLAFHVAVIAAIGTLTFATVKRSDAGPPMVIRSLPTQVQKIEMPESRNRSLLNNPVGREDGADYAPDEKQIQMPPWMEESDHYESANGVDGNTFAGDPSSNGFGGDLDAGIGRLKNGVGANVSIGVGGDSGGGGHWGNGPGGRTWKRKKAPKLLTSSVDVGLKWLARHQAPDGHWSAQTYDECCTSGKCVKHEYDRGLADFDTGVTGLALLAFLGSGYTPQIRESFQDPFTKKWICFGDVVRKGLEWLLQHQDQTGNIGPTHVHEQMYNHAIATLALAEAYGLTNAVKYRAPSQKAVNFITQAQNYDLGWRYKPKCGDNDTSVTGWCVMALKSAQISGLDVSQTSYVGAKGWVAKVTEDNGHVGYNKIATGEVCVPGKNDRWQHHAGSMTAVGMLVRIYVDKKKDDPALAKGTKFLLDDLPKWDANSDHPTVDFYYWYYATLTLFQLDGAEGPSFKKWIKPLVEVLTKHQRTQDDGCLDGSWDTGNVDRWGWAGGRVYGTAINVLTLEVYWRYQSLLGGRK